MLLCPVLSRSRLGQSLLQSLPALESVRLIRLGTVSTQRPSTGWYDADKLAATDLIGISIASDNVAEIRYNREGVGFICPIQASARSQVQNAAGYGLGHDWVGDFAEL